jgi:glycosyltransferase involved in cell wall biosynthesis
MKISFIIPCRSNAKYFKWAYESIRKHQGHHDVYICAANDASEDNTVFLFHEIAANDPKFTYITNPGPERVGHTILYDRIINELVQTGIAIIWHADMYLCPGALDEIENLMYDVHISLSQPTTIFKPRTVPKYKTIVSLTRIEPPLHPAGPEKETYDWGTEPEDFNESAFLQWFTDPGPTGFKPKRADPTNGIFAPWAFFIKDFQEIGGHDPLYRPQSKEDSDIFNRFKLNGCTFIQTWKGFAYHMTCRGSRFNPTLTTPGINSKEWEEHNVKSARNFVRKWGYLCGTYSDA